MSLERTPLRSLDEIAPRAMSARPKKPMSIQTVKKIQRTARRNRFRTARIAKRPSTQRKAMRTHRIHKGRGLKRVGGRIVRLATSGIAARVHNRMQKLRRTGSYSPYKRKSGSSAGDVGFMTRVEAYETLVNQLHESRRGF